MNRRISFEDAVKRISHAVFEIEPPLIAIDGLPCSGKSTLADALQKCLGLECIYLDDFVLPKNEWPSEDTPSFPFSYIRYNDFLESVTTLALTGKCTYVPFDWSTLTLSAASRTVELKRPVIIEGVSSLNPSLCEFYGMKIFMESDRSTTLQAAIERGAGLWEREWQTLFLPSADLYMKSQPEKRADLVVAGRGISAL